MASGRCAWFTAFCRVVPCHGFAPSVRFTTYTPHYLLPIYLHVPPPAYLATTPLSPVHAGPAAAVRHPSLHFHCHYYFSDTVLHHDVAAGYTRCDAHFTPPNAWRCATHCTTDAFGYRTTLDCGRLDVALLPIATRLRVYRVPLQFAPTRTAHDVWTRTRTVLFTGHFIALRRVVCPAFAVACLLRHRAYVYALFWFTCSRDLLFQHFARACITAATRRCGLFSARYARFGTTPRRTYTLVPTLRGTALLPCGGLTAAR